MARFTSPLEGVRVAAPCPADWGRMAGDDRVRFCSECSLNVYNLSGMTRREAEALLTRSEGRVCVRFYRRGDGTILTKQCPVGLRALKARAGRAASAVFSAAVGFFGGLGFHGLAGGGVTQGETFYPVTGATVEHTVGELRVSSPPENKVVPVQGTLAIKPGYGIEGTTPPTKLGPKSGAKRPAPK